MYLTKRLSITIFFSLSCLYLIGQPNFQEGFVITNNGDTMRGQVDYRDWYINPKQINFQNEEGRNFTFKTGDIKYFEVRPSKNQVEQFYSGSLYIDETPTAYVIEDSTDKPRLKHVSYFLRYLVKAELSLFSLIDDREKAHLIVKKGNGQLEALFYKKYYAIKDEDDFSPKYVKNLVEVTRYKAQLRKLTVDCSTIADDDIERLRFERKLIERFIIDYNQCAHPEKLAYLKPKESWKFRFWAGGGIGYTNFQPAANVVRLEFLNREDIPAKLYPSVTLGMQMTLPKTSEKLHLCTELSFKAFQHEIASEIILPNGVITNEATISYTYPLTLRS